MSAERPAATVSYRTLSEPQKRHLREMVNEHGETRYWHPANQGERACAAKLKRLGLLEGSALTANDAYWLSETGLKLARGLAANPDV